MPSLPLLVSSFWSRAHKMFGTNQHRSEPPGSHTPSHRTPQQSSIQTLLCSPVWAGLQLAPGSKRFWGHHLPPGFAYSESCSQTPRWRNSADRRKQTRAKIVSFAWMNIRCLSGQLRIREIASLKTIWSSSSRCLRGRYAITISKMSKVLPDLCRLQTLEV